MDSEGEGFRSAMSAPPPLVPVIQVLLGHVELGVLGEADQAHVQVVPKDHVHLLDLFLSAREGSFFFFNLPFPSVKNGFSFDLKCLEVLR